MGFLLLFVLLVLSDLGTPAGKSHIWVAFLDLLPTAAPTPLTAHCISLVIFSKHFLCFLVILAVFLFPVCQSPRKSAIWGQGLCNPSHCHSPNSIHMDPKSEWINEWMKNGSLGNLAGSFFPQDKKPPGDTWKMPWREDNDRNLTCVYSTLEFIEYFELPCLHSTNKKCFLGVTRLVAAKSLNSGSTV